ncbi:LYR motif-containing protein 4 isoform X2 [Mirounga leonina]|uniref:LYR motif-containing protein 4 isoform X2 n=1 Tax=Mirounga leonina TaxID=9715 RepID=UPI00156C1596|nr:LYR motif-containing protein 4 isoform X2 [Mirounga leonina]
MAASSRAQVLDLYRAMLRESKHFSAYNYRTYAVRRIRDAFRENKNVKDPVEIQALVNKAKRDLGIIRRQMFLSHCGLPGNEMKERLQANKKSR